MSAEHVADPLGIEGHSTRCRCIVFPIVDPEPGLLPKLYDVVERVRDADGQGRRTDTVTGDLVRAIRRRDEMRRQGRPAYVTDAGGRRIEVSW